MTISPISSGLIARQDHEQAAAQKRPPKPASVERDAAQAQGQARLDWLQKPGLPGLTSEAFEEITFQASENEEAEMHDEALTRETHRRDQVGSTVPVEQVQEVMRLLEGHQGYMTLRHQARRFAQMWQRDPQAAMDLLSPASYPPAQRYAVIRMAADLIEKTDSLRESNRLPLLDQFQTLDQPDDPQLRKLFAVLEATHRTNNPSEGPSPTERTSSLMQLLAGRPTVRVLMDASPSLDGVSAINEQARSAAKAGRFTSAAAEVGMLVGMSRLVGLVRTMGAHGEALAATARTPGSANPPTVLKVTRALFDACGAAAPAPMMEKLFTGALQVSRQNRSEVEGHLLGQIPKYPDLVWLNQDTKGTMQKLLRDSLGMELRRQGVIGIAGSLDRTQTQRARLLNPTREA